MLAAWAGALALPAGEPPSSIDGREDEVKGGSHFGPKLPEKRELATKTLLTRNEQPAREYIPLDISSDTLHYLATLYMGTPPQPLRVILDTGSMDLVVFTSSYCRAVRLGGGG